MKCPTINIKENFFSLLDNTQCTKRCMRYLGLRDADQIHSKLRTIYMNNEKPADYSPKYVSNRIKTSKYNFVTFLPKNMCEQFRRVTNIYFLIVNVISFFVPDQPTNPYLGMIPLVFVVLVTAIKQAYEDILRHRSDKEVNNLPVRILTNGQFAEKKWEDIRCGDIVEVKAETQLPCDLVLLHSETEDDICFKTTANLDGETNLKRRSVPPKLPLLNNEANLEHLRGVIQCDKPNLRLYEFSGKIIIDGQQIPIVNENILLRGSTLKIAPVIYGCAIYTGMETKMMLNTKFKSNKFSCIERQLNVYTGVFLLFLCLLTFGCFAASLVYESVYSSHWYLQNREPPYYVDNKNLSNFIILITIMNFFNYIIPLPTYVTIELQRFVGSKFIEWDLELYDEKTNQTAKVNTSDLNEDLGQIEYLFSDKTGTLTENEMEFKQFSINGKIYEDTNGEIHQIASNKNIDLLAVCSYNCIFFLLPSY